jgi:hypothetical protein
MLPKQLSLVLWLVVFILALMPLHAVNASCISQVCTPTPGPTSAGGVPGSHAGKNARLTATALAQQNAAPAAPASQTAAPIPTYTAILPSSTPTGLQSPTPTNSGTPTTSQTPTGTSAPALAGGQSAAGSVPKGPLPEAAISALTRTLLIGLGLSALVLAFIGAALISRGLSRKNGRLVQLDQRKKVDYEKQFHDQLINEIGFPAMDASAKDQPPPESGLDNPQAEAVKKAGDAQLAKKLGKDLTAGQ